MNYFSETLAFFFFFMLGVVLMLWVKINDLNNMKEELTIKKTVILFLNKEWKSYGFSITFALIYAGAHDEWMSMIMNSSWTPGFVIKNFGAAPMIASAFFGVVVQYTGYKFWLGKLEKLFRKEIVEEQANLKAENESLKNILNNKN